MMHHIYDSDARYFPPAKSERTHERVALRQATCLTSARKESSRGDCTSLRYSHIQPRALCFHLTAFKVRDTVPHHSGRVQESRPVQAHRAAFLLPAKTKVRRRP